MTDLAATLPDTVRELDAMCREYAEDLRVPGMALDADPEAIGGFLDLPAVTLQRQVLTPAEYRTDGLHGMSCLAWVVVAERLSYGDPGMVLASPGPSLSSADRASRVSLTFVTNFPPNAAVC